MRAGFALWVENLFVSGNVFWEPNEIQGIYFSQSGSFWIFSLGCRHQKEVGLFKRELAYLGLRIDINVDSYLRLRVQDDLHTMNL